MRDCSKSPTLIWTATQIFSLPVSHNLFSLESWVTAAWGDILEERAGTGWREAQLPPPSASTQERGVGLHSSKAPHAHVTHKGVCVSEEFSSPSLPAPCLPQNSLYPPPALLCRHILDFPFHGFLLEKASLPRLSIFSLYLRKPFGSICSHILSQPPPLFVPKYKADAIWCDMTK